MKIGIVSRWTWELLFSCEAESMMVALQRAVKEGANLVGAYLRGANLGGANLEGAKGLLAKAEGKEAA